MGSAAEEFQPELNVLFALFLWMTVYRGHPTPGMAMLNMQYQDGKMDGSRAAKCTGTPRKSQCVWLGLAWVLAPWAFQRLRRFGLSNSGPSQSAAHRKVCSVALERGDSFWRYAHLFNVIAFFRASAYRRYPLVSERLFGMQLRQTQHGNNPQAPSLFRPLPNFQFANRLLLCEHVAAVSVSIAPFVDPLLHSLWRLRRRLRLDAPADGISTAQSWPTRVLQWWRKHAMGVPSNALTDVQGCALCGTSPAATPYNTSCGHTFCYYCVKDACMLNPAFPCVSCRRDFLSGPYEFP
jgi:hypothetical protein